MTGAGEPGRIREPPGRLAHRPRGPEPDSTSLARALALVLIPMEDPDVALRRVAARNATLLGSPTDQAPAGLRVREVVVCSGVVFCVPRSTFSSATRSGVRL